MATSNIKQPENDMTYDVEIGPTMERDSDFVNNEQYHTLQYNLKPKSLDTSKALIKMNQGSIHIQHNHTSTNEKFDFFGAYKPCKEMECLLIFENGVFRLERQISSSSVIRKLNSNSNRCRFKY
ncbi:hypothetical protein DDB_G0270900 [Dictyostelium discoideum AX4]|uniref:Transcription elongation factor Eaf N-terminal domain-containing protein n=1 Tax=Dictyostelium discoideum TaxID=44689 RepID=Q55DI5_DICDI|nr:hypothetical protein DDB_G0270900 [Dictyostelium discoideum AX4]EAL72800.1 hypothetical protein DDB_G0270900 [Dictyostelium discoideum AX4]|eukprot:XP_646146.1 hypothetical protein DDB_G0270900 [Dictyostelium discoideum AX4]